VLFSSITFLFVFLAATLILYAIAPKIYLKNIILLAFSLVFYSWGEPRLVLLMVVSVAFGYVFGLLMEKYRENVKLRKLFMIISVIISGSFLVYYKYANFFIDNINLIPGVDIPLVNVTLPVGISFYTFQIISYTVDVYREETPAQKSFARLLLYVSCFPQLIAGPIVQYGDVAAMILDRKSTVDGFVSGMKRFAFGLAKKVILANICGAALEQLTLAGGGQSMSVAGAWYGAFMYSLQIYFDFSAYSDMAIGL